MDVVNTFRYVSIFSRIFAIFPYTPTKTENGFVATVSSKILFRSRVICVAITITRATIFTLDLFFNISGSRNLAPVAFREVNTCILHLIAVIVYRGIVKRCHTMCEWLNKMNEIFGKNNVNCQQLAVFDRLIICYSFLFFFATNVPACVGLWTNAKFINGWISFFDSICFIMWLAIENLNLCKLLIFSNIVRAGYKRINEILGEKGLKHEEKEALVGKLLMLRAQHMDITDFYDFLNAHYGWNLLVYVFWSFSSLLFSAVSIVMFDLGDALILIVWSAYHPCQNVPIHYMCENVSSEAKGAANQLHQLLIESDDEEVKEQIEIFSLQIQHRPAEFNVCGFFTLDFPLLHSMTAVVTTYIIALLQFHTQPAAEVSINSTVLI